VALGVVLALFLRALSGEIKTQQAALVDLAVRAKLLVDSVDAHVLGIGVGRAARFCVRRTSLECVATPLFAAGGSL
jgi:hypothetical protein